MRTVITDDLGPDIAAAIVTSSDGSVTFASSDLPADEQNRLVGWLLLIAAGSSTDILGVLTTLIAIFA